MRVVLGQNAGGEAIKLGGATYVLSPEKIASKVTELVMGRRKGHR